MIKLTIITYLLFTLTKSQNLTITNPTIECMANTTDINKIDCPNKNIDGQNTEKIICMNKYSCQNTKFNIITPGESFNFEASAFSFSNGQLTVPGNVESIKCDGIMACTYTTWQLVGTINDGFKIECKGVDACGVGSRALIYPIEIDCEGMFACSETQWGILLMSGKDVFKVNCKEMDSCYSSLWGFELPHDYRIEYEIEGWLAGDLMHIVINAAEGASAPNAELIINCNLGKDDTPSCNDIVVTAISPATVNCIVYCKPGACQTITGCTIQESFKIGSNKKLSTKETTIIVTLSSIVSLLIVIVLIIFCYYKHKKDTHVKFEDENDNENENDVDINKDDSTQPQTETIEFETNTVN